VRDVQPGETHPLGGQNQLRQRRYAQAERVQVDDAVERADALRVALVLVQGGGAGQLDALPDQAQENAVHDAHP
jgi:hypothetical protein